MARLWSTGFEANSTTAWHEFTSAVGTCSIGTTTKRTGSYALRCNPSSSTGYISHTYKTSPGTEQNFFRAYIYIASAPTANTWIMGKGVGTGTGVRLNTDRTLTLMKEDNTAIGSNSSALDLNTWYMVEFQFQTFATINARLNGTSFASGTNSSSGSFDSIYFGILTSCTADVYFDDLAVNDTSGSSQNSWPGAGGIIHLYPNGAGNSNTLLKSGGGAGSSTNYQDMDEIAPDDNTTYLKTTATGDNDKNDAYVLENASSKGVGASDTVNLVAWRGRWYLGNSNNWSGVVGRIRYNSTNTDSGIIEADTASSWRTFKQGGTGTIKGNELLTAYVAPGGGAWSQSVLDSTEAGVVSKVNTFNSENRFSQVYLLVEFIASGVVALPPKGTSVFQAVNRSASF